MGTTSTLNILLHEWCKQGIIGVYIDLRTLPKIDADRTLAPRILSELHMEPISGRKWWTHIHSRVPKFVLALDEFDLVQGPMAHSFMSWLVTSLPFYLQLGGNRPFKPRPSPILGIILGSHQSLFDIERALECIDSPWYNHFACVRLQPLSYNEAFELVHTISTNAGCSLRREASWIVKFAGTWPFFLKLACHYVFEHKLGSEHAAIAKSARLRLEQQIMEDALPFLDNLWAWFSPRQCDLLTNLSAWQEFDNQWRNDPDVASLLGQGILKTVRHGLQYSSELFRTYFANMKQDETLVGHSMPSRESALSSIAKTLSRLGTCTSELTHWDDSKETSIQEIAYVMLRSQYDRVRREVHTSDGPKRAYRSDLHVEDVDIVVEVKRIRNSAHAASLQAELNDDIIGYRQKNVGGGIVFVIWDSERYIRDRDYFRQAYEGKDRLLRLVFVP